MKTGEKDVPLVLQYLSALIKDVVTENTQWKFIKNNKMCCKKAHTPCQLHLAVISYLHVHSEMF